MNDVLKTIENRRSTRGFLEEQINKDDLEKIINAGFLAPSAMNTQDWHFVVVQDKTLLNDLNEKAKAVLPEVLRERMKARFNGSEDYSLFYDAPTVIFIFAKDGEHYSSLNSSYASQNMVLASESLGYNSCYIGSIVSAFADQTCYDMLKVPSGYKISIAIAMGKGKIEMPKSQRDFTKVTYFL